MAYSSDLSSVDLDNHQELQILKALTRNSAAPAPSRKTSEPLSRWDLWANWHERGVFASIERAKTLPTLDDATNPWFSAKGAQLPAEFPSCEVLESVRNCSV